MAGSKNLGQVAGIYVGTTPPENIKMIWWDSTSSQQCHKIYDYNLKQWIILNQGILSTITYTELRNIALTVGLSLGKFYVVTDKGNVLALSITRTKVQYVDISGNLLVDDLGSNIQYYVSSNNLTIDGETGVFNQESTKLNFNFVEAVPNIDTAYIYGKDRTSSSSSVMRLIKFKLSSLISTVTGNALTWNSGLYFNFNQTLLDLGDKKGGVVLFDTYTKEQEVQDQSIENIANNYNALVSQVNALVTSATSDVNIMNKKITALQTGGEPIDAAAGDTLYTVLSKFQRYINKFKYATGIFLSKNFSELNVSGNVNNNDSVETALAKLQNKVGEINTDTVEVSKNFKIPDISSEVVIGDTLTNALGKLQKQVKTVGTDSLVDNSVDMFKLSSLITQCYLEFRMSWDGSKWTTPSIEKIFIPSGISVTLGSPIVSDGTTFRWHMYVSDSDKKGRTRVINSEILSFDAFDLGYANETEPYVVRVYNRGTQGIDGMGFKMSQNINGKSGITLEGSLFFLIEKEQNV